MTDSFQPDESIRQIAEAYSLDAVEFAEKTFRTKLDWSDLSIREVEKVLAYLHNDIKKSKPTEEQVFQLAKAFGSYVGEVYKRNHGATWGMVTLGDESFPGMQVAGSSLNFWPWGRAQNRIINGPEDNIWHYYQVLLSKTGAEIHHDDGENQSNPGKKSWWKRLRGA